MEKRTEELLECVLTDKELIDYGNKLSRKNQEKVGLDEHRKALASEYKAKIDACDAEISTLSLAVSTKREFRNVECEIKFNEPSVGQKTVVRLDTDEVIKIMSMTRDENNDLLINALGDQEDRFVFRSRRAVDIVDQKDCSTEDGDKWETLGQPASEQNLVDAHIEKDKVYRVIRGEDENSGKIKYQLQVSKVEAKPETKPEENKEAEKPAEEKPAEPPKEETKTEPASEPVKSGDLGDTFVFPDGRKVEIVAFTDVEADELNKAFKEKRLMIKGKEDSKTVPFRKDDLLKVELPNCECKVIRGGTPELPGYYVWTFPDKPLKKEEKPENIDVCGHAHEDGRTCKRPAGHDGKHSYGQLKKKPLAMGDKPKSSEEKETSPPENEAEETKTDDKSKDEPKTSPVVEALEGKGVKVIEAEAYLRKEGRLGFTMALASNPKLVDEITSNLDEFVKQVKDAGFVKDAA